MELGQLATFGSVAGGAVGTVVGITVLGKLLIEPLKTDIAALKSQNALILAHILKE